MEESTDWQRYCMKLDAVSSASGVHLLKDSMEAFTEMMAAVKGAKKYVLMEFYDISDDAAGRIFAGLMKERSANGVKIYIIRDAVGSILTDRGFFSELSAAGARVAEFRPIVPWKPYSNWVRRDHRKMICVDGEAAFVGGFNISQSDLPRAMGGRGWKNAMARVKGPVVAEIEKLFWESWEASSMEDASTVPLKPAAPAQQAGPVPVAVVSALGMRDARSVRRSYSYAIEAATRYIYITNAYFVPDRMVYRRLVRAAERGVDVRILAPFKTDHPYVRWGAWAKYVYMLKRGIRIYEWQGEFLHSKIAVIDGIWASVGSHNLDHRSLHYNLELNINVFSRQFGEEVKQLFMEDLKGSRELTLAEARARPLLLKMMSRLFYMLRSWG